MIYLLIFISIFFYWVLFRNTQSILVKPTLQKLVFFREYLFLTMIPYLYYIYDDRYQSHYIYSQLDSDIYFKYAAIFAFIFIVFFLLTYKFLEPALSKSISKFNVPLNFSRLKKSLRFLTVFFVLYLVVVTIKNDAGLIGLMKFNLLELESKRAFLTQGSGFLTLNKIILKSWVPILSYLYLYLYWANKFRFNRVDKVFLSLSIISGVMASIWFFEKSVIVFYLFGVAGIYVYSGRLLSKKLTLLFPFAVIFLVALMYTSIYQEKIVDNQYLVDILLHRTFSQSTGSVMAIHYFSNHDYFYFSGVSNLLASISGDTFQSPYGAIIDFYVPETAEYSGAMSSFVVGEAFGLFGLFGVLLSGVIVGIYYSFLEATKHSNFLAVIFVGLYGLFFSHFYVASSFYSFLWPIGFAYSIAPFILLAIFSSINFKWLFNYENPITRRG